MFHVCSAIHRFNLFYSPSELRSLAPVSFGTAKVGNFFKPANFFLFFLKLFFVPSVCLLCFRYFKSLSPNLLVFLSSLPPQRVAKVGNFFAFQNFFSSFFKFFRKWLIASLFLSKPPFFNLSTTIPVSRTPPPKRDAKVAKLNACANIRRDYFYGNS